MFGHKNLVLLYEESLSADSVNAADVFKVTMGMVTYEHLSQFDVRMT